MNHDNTEHAPYDQQAPASNIIAAGSYLAHAVAHGLTETKGGAPQFAIEFEIEDDCLQHGWHITGFFGFSTEKAEEFTFGVLETCGWDGQTALNAIPDLPAQVRIVIEHEEYEDSVSARVRYVNPPTRPTGALIEKKRMDDNKASQVAADLLAKYRMRKGGSNVQVAAPAARPQMPAATSAVAASQGGRQAAGRVPAGAGAPARAPARRAPAPEPRTDDEIPF